MESIDTIRVFLGWCTALNLGMLMLSSIILVAGGKAIAGWHASMFDLDAAEVRKEYFQYLSRYKALFLIFNLVPFLALRIMV